MASNYKFSKEEMAAIKTAHRETKDKRADARSCFLVMPYCNSACMNLFLRELSKQFPLDTILMCCDGAAWHKSGTLEVPENIVLFHIPPYLSLIHI